VTLEETLLPMMPRAESPMRRCRMLVACCGRPSGHQMQALADGSLPGLVGGGVAGVSAASSRERLRHPANLEAPALAGRAGALPSATPAPTSSRACGRSCAAARAVQTFRVRYDQLSYVSPGARQFGWSAIASHARRRSAQSDEAQGHPLQGTRHAKTDSGLLRRP
jgi:hypothetical protein